MLSEQGYCEPQRHPRNVSPGLNNNKDERQNSVAETTGEHRERVDEQQRRQAEVRAAGTSEKYGERVDRKRVTQGK